MGITVNGILDTGIRAVKALQVAMATTSHNISNVNTEGYTRQRADMAATLALNSNPGQIGTGVEVSQVVRLRQPTLDALVQTEVGQLGQWTQNQQTTGVLQTMLGDATNGKIGSAFSDFFNSWHDLTTAPEEAGLRQVVVDNGTQLADAFRDASGRLDSLNNGLNLSVTSSVNDANSYITSIAQLNQEIATAELGGHNNANDLRDQRDLAVEKLSAITDLTVTTQSNGMVDIDIGGNSVVNGINTTALTGVLNGATNHMEVFIGATPLPFSSGSFQGYKDSFAALDSTRTTLDSMAATVVSEVNNLHTSGFDLNGNPGGAFFTGANAANIDVSAALKTSPNLVAASSSIGGVPGNGDVALQMAQLQSKKVYPAGVPQYTFNESFNNLVLSLGSQARQANQRVSDFTNAVKSVKDQRDAISGVNTDEEVANMLNFQRAYQAAARVITNVDDMMDRLINHTGRVGL